MIPIRPATLLCSVSLVLPLLGQGSFTNFETPQTHPLEIASVAGEDWVLVCNTPDDSVEIYRAAPPHEFVQRVRVGLGPASVRWSPALGRMFVCNFDGDSISIVRLEPQGSSVQATLERTDSYELGDEPSDVALDPTGSMLAVSLSSSGSTRLLDPTDLTPLAPPARLQVLDPASFQQFVLKAPRQIEWRPDGRFFALNFRAGSPAPSANGPGSDIFQVRYDAGLYRLGPGQPGSAAEVLGGMGSTLHAFALDASGSTAFVVGTSARNHDAAGVQAVGALPTGFVQSWLWVADVAAGAPMQLHPEAPAGGATGGILPSINLNRDYGQSGLAELPTTGALVQPSDVLLLEDARGKLETIVLSAYHADRVALLSPAPALPGGYAIQRVDLDTISPSADYSMVGPRGLAHSAATGLVFVNGRLDNSLAVIDPTNGGVTARLQLQNDPTPATIRRGREFLYSNRFSIDDAGPTPSGGFVSCAACHVDGRTDGLPWDLGGLLAGPAIPPGYHDLDGEDLSSMPLFPSEKGPMVTQTLQGLVNHQIEGTFQAIATNAPYHWRGDKASFTDFNEAFVNLQGMDDVGGGRGTRGISDAQMQDFQAFVQTIRHPPNPEQDPYRATTGNLGSDPNDPAQASGAKLGLQLFHNVGTVALQTPLVGSRSCVDCHNLPDGSGNTASLTFITERTLSGGRDQSQPMESAGLRNLAQREMALHNGFDDQISAYSANSGLLHPGDFAFQKSFSINTFITFTFENAMPGPDEDDVDEQLAALVEFVRGMDWGIAPLVGFAYTVDGGSAPPDTGLDANVFDSLEDQVRQANIGLGVHARSQGITTGYWYDITLDPPMYRAEGTQQLITRDQLLALASGPDDVVIAQGTPLGGERRWSSANGIATPISDPAQPPQELALEPMAPGTPYLDVTLFDGNLHAPNPPLDSSIWTLRTLQQSVAGLGLGVPSVRHEPPRRLRVSGEHIRPGARLHLAMASGSNPASLPVQILELALYPTGARAAGRQVWETELELDATQTMALLNGGYLAPDVASTLARSNRSPLLQPQTWNRYLVGVENEDGSFELDATDWQVLTVQDGR